MVMDIEEGNDDTVFGKFPKPTYAAEQMKEIKFPLFSQCNVPGHHDVLKVEEEYIDASCYPNMTAVNRVCESQNCWIGKIFYRGSKVKYENEICTFNRGEPKDRKMYLHNLLLVAKHLPKEIPDVFSDQSDMLSTIKILGLVHQYEDVFNEILNGSGNHTKKTYIATPMLDFTKDLRVAASMAINQHNMKNQGVVRILLVPPSTPVEEKNGRRQESWKEFKVGSYVKRLGKTNMLLIDFEVICPAFARRPLHQKVYFIVYEEDLLNFHTLRLSGVKLGTSMIHDEELQCLTDNVKTREALHSLVYNEDKWDALNWRIVDVRIPGDVMKEEFFHEIESKYKDEKGEVKVVMRNPSPLLSAKYLYPERDPMREVMIKVAQQIKNLNLEEARHNYNIKAIEKKKEQREENYLDAAENGIIDVVKEYICNDVTTAAKDKFGWTELNLGIWYDHLDVGRYFMGYTNTTSTSSVNKEVEDNGGRTALHLASYNGHLNAALGVIDTIRELIERIQALAKKINTTDYASEKLAQRVIKIKKDIIKMQGIPNKQKQIYVDELYQLKEIFEEVEMFLRGGQKHWRKQNGGRKRIRRRKRCNELYDRLDSAMLDFYFTRLWDNEGQPRSWRTNWAVAVFVLCVLLYVISCIISATTEPNAPSLALLVTRKLSAQ